MYQMMCVDSLVKDEQQQTIVLCIIRNHCCMVQILSTWTFTQTHQQHASFETDGKKPALCCWFVSQPELTLCNTTSIVITAMFFNHQKETETFLCHQKTLSFSLIILITCQGHLVLLTKANHRTSSK